MNKVYLIETHPVSKEYFTDIHCGYVNITNKVEDARTFATYDFAQNTLIDIINSDYESEVTLYLSIVEFHVK